MRTLSLRSFRNYESCELSLGEGINLFVGRNGSGKTNILEALAISSLTRSPRGSLSECVQWGQSLGNVRVEIEKATGLRTVEVELAGENNTERAHFSLDGARVGARELLGIAPVVSFWPHQLALVREGPSHRRLLLDQMMGQADPIVARDLIDYRKITAHRNALLAEQQRGQRPDGAQEKAFREQAATTGARIIRARARALAAISPTYIEALTDMGIDDCGLSYESSILPAGDEDTSSVESRLRVAMENMESQEKQRGHVLIGPHRDDLSLTYRGRMARVTASQGEQRAMVLALVWMQARYLTAAFGVPPILLLDDVVSELDPGREGKFVDQLISSASQVMISAADPTLASHLPTSRRFIVDSGHVELSDVA